MKRKLIITCVCLGMLGFAVSCSGDEEATQANAESASPQVESGDAQDSAAKAAKSNDSPRKKRKKAEAKETETDDRSKMTHTDCLPSSVPDSAHPTAKLCISLANSAPDMVFSERDYEGMPEECKPYVNEKCR